MRDLAHSPERRGHSRRLVLKLGGLIGAAGLAGCSWPGETVPNGAFAIDNRPPDITGIVQPGRFPRERIDSTPLAQLIAEGIANRRCDTAAEIAHRVQALRVAPAGALPKGLTVYDAYMNYNYTANFFAVGDTISLPGYTCVSMYVTGTAVQRGRRLLTNASFAIYPGTLQTPPDSTGNGYSLTCNSGASGDTVWWELNDHADYPGPSGLRDWPQPPPHGYDYGPAATWDALHATYDREQRITRFMLAQVPVLPGAVRP
ncbi:MAG TPA: hypothetical protein VLE99_00805 [Candidatus Saccharimonadales bacterium]|nr:hypothetical protein [Candidatus Saccharimonadales bacterium]